MTLTRKTLRHSINEDEGYNIWTVLQDLNETMSYAKGKREKIEEQCTAREVAFKELETKTKDIEQARTIINEVAAMTQEELSFHVSGLVTLALQAVFGPGYEMKMTFESKRGKTEARIKLCKDGQEFDPIAESGGGVVDIMAFALRVSIWHLSTPSTRGVFVLDEPFRFVSAKYRPLVAEMIGLLSTKLRIQFLIVTHDPDMMEGADRVYRVSHDGKRSQLEE